MADTTNLQSWTAQMYRETLEAVPEKMAELLDKYSGIPPGQQQIDHIVQVRNKAYQAHKYPCLGRFRFLEIDLAKQELYTSYVLPAMQGRLDGQTEVPLYLELGTCLGQDIRKLIFDGADTDRCYGTDILPEFIEAGYELFKDGDRLTRSHFICPADVFDKTSNDPLASFNDRIGIIHATAVFHLFTETKQEELARRCVRLLSKKPGRRLILGCQAGHVSGTESARLDGVPRLRHNEQTWRSLWDTICAEVEFKDLIKDVQVEAKMFDPPVLAFRELARARGSLDPEGFRWMHFQVWITF